ncbi:hypothetical protein L2E82_20247 [Cichorium intybus]|uniref:Uncharacterized protein n=1 Tax=Cichorium intybus TaxID=13427 RepID=A0ACB9DST2_CICIN|nr:hypothetical protein L2E82_20247 [Cichorium intybus]
MGTSTKEKGVLKLVHPGRHVEYHRQSVTAGEIMRSHPRHSITRPDFFKNPYLVVRPESVMVPGQVFYIVPNKTVHKLVKRMNKQFDQLAPQSNESPNTSDYNHSNEMAGRTPISSHQFPNEQEGSSSCAENTRGCLVDDMLDDSDGLTFQARDFYLNRIGSAWATTSTTNYGQQGTNLKSCMKKEGSVRKSQNLRVTFDFSTIKEVQTSNFVLPKYR